MPRLCSVLTAVLQPLIQGAFGGQQQITVQSEDGRSYVAVHPDTIIVQDSEELVISGDGQEGEQQYVIQYVTAPGQEDGNNMLTTTEVGADTEVAADGHQLVDQHGNPLVNQQVSIIKFIF